MLFNTQTVTAVIAGVKYYESVDEIIRNDPSYATLAIVDVVRKIGVRSEGVYAVCKSLTDVPGVPQPGSKFLVKGSTVVNSPQSFANGADLVASIMSQADNEPGTASRNNPDSGCVPRPGFECKAESALTPDLLGELESQARETLSTAKGLVNDFIDGAGDIADTFANRVGKAFGNLFGGVGEGLSPMVIAGVGLLAVFVIVYGRASKIVK